MPRAFVQNIANRIEPSGGTPITAAPFTFGGWITADSSMSANGVFLAISDTASNDDFWELFVNNAGGVLSFAVRPQPTIEFSGTTDLTSSGGVTYHHCLGVERSATNRELYVDGTSENTNTTSRTPSGIDSLSIGFLFTNGDSDPFFGDAAHMALWDTDLNDDEISALASGFSPMLIRPANLVSYWPLWGNDGPEPEVIEGRNGVIIGTVNKSDADFGLFMPQPHQIVMPPRQTFVRGTVFDGPIFR
jgi:hypothetical protein